VSLPTFREGRPVDCSGREFRIVVGAALYHTAKERFGFIIMAELTKVWLRTSAIDSVYHPTSISRGGGRLGQSLTNDYDADNSNTKVINWGWTRGTIVSGGHTGADGLLDSSADIMVEINDPSNDYDRRTVPIPGSVVDNGDVVMQNDHRGDRDDDDDDLYNDNNYEDDGPLGYPDDLIVLTHLHEPAVVHCLKMRYERDAIYTNTGPILIALNPFKNCSNLYSDTVMRKYWERGEIRSLTGGSGSDEEVKCIGSGKDVLPPHVYDLADSTYRSMMLKMDVEGNSSSNRGGSRGGGGCDQSILVSGESGAGKTVTTKFIMQYLATLSERKAEVVAAEAAKHKSVVMKSSSDKNKKSSNTTFQRRNSSGHVGIEQQVLQSNPILESFGNARTIRNDNSSRFGKFIEIRFDMFGTLVGASVETYLLEKVRLISQSEGERNYHIFYEMLCGMNNDELSRYLLGEHTVEDFRITSRSGTYDRRDGVRDADTYGDLVDALDIMGFETERQYDLFGIASAILHLSNLTINPTKGGEECEIDTENVHLGPVLNLLGVTRENLNQAMCYFQIEARGQSYTRAVQKDKAEKGLEALMKATYSALFDYIVRTINLSITVKKSVTGEGGGSRAATRGGGSCSAVIGVLDIFGFESFKTNSFEQLCINYCNESLQQQFNSFVLKNEQDIYEQEGINWSFISFPDNQDALDLIWKKGYGILNILDDQCRAPGTTDKTFANDLYQKLTNKPRFEANFRQVGARQFGVYHYAGLVEYDTDGFVEKNKDELPREATDLLLSSSSAFVRDLAAIISSSSASPTTSSVSSAPLRGGAKKSVTVGGHFASQLQSLRAKIELTSPHYVRCLKPNGLLVPDNFDPLMIVEQLRCAGVVEAVRVSRVGYPQRYNHSQFVSRYRTLGLREMKKAAKSSSRSVKPVVVLVDTISKKMMEIMEKSQLLTSSPTPNDRKTKSSAHSVDSLAVGIQVGKTKVFLRRRAFDIIEQMRKGHLAVAAIKVQTIARGYINRRSYLEFCEANLHLQCWVRLILAIRKVQIVREHSNSKRIQSMYRQYVARAAYLNVLIIVKWCQSRHRGIVGRATYEKLVKLKRSATIIQCVIRIKQSRQILLNLKHEAKNLQNVAGERDKFRERMEEMRIEMERVKAAKMKAEDAAQALREQAGEANKSSNLQDELDRLRGESVAHLNELDRLRGESVAQINELNHLRDELASVKMKLGEEQEKSRDATECEQYTKLQLETARESIAQLEMTISEASLTTEGNLLQDKLDEALDLVRMKEEEIKMLKCELSTKESALSIPQSRISREEDLNEIKVLKKELKKAKMKASRNDDSSEYTSLSLELEINRLREENKGLREQSSQPPSQSLEKEKKLKIEVAKVKDANKMILKTAEEQYATLKDLEMANAKLQSENAALQEASLNVHTSDATSSYNDLKERLHRAESRLGAEHTRAEEAVAREASLRAEIDKLRSRKLDENCYDKSTFLHQSSIDEDEQQDNSVDLSTLQYEIERLRSELRLTKEAKDDWVTASSSVNDDIIHEFNELKRVSEQKDMEIKRLKLRVSTQDAKLQSKEEEVTEDDLRFGRRDSGSANNTTDEAEGLRVLNEELTKQLGLYVEELEDAKVTLKEEKRRAEMEMKAFAGALLGVDDLRVAAEKMSRQLTLIKKNGYDPTTGLSLIGEDTTENIAAAMRAVEAMARANQSIDHPSLSTKPAVTQQQPAFNLWNIMNTVLSPAKPIADFFEDETPGDTLFTTIIDKRGPISSSTNKPSRRKKKKSAGGSVISSFF